MISFLVKLANLLDTRGQHSMAREVDDLIEKMAQMSSPDDNMSVAPESTPAEKGQQLISAYQAAARASDAAREAWEEANKAANARPGNEALLNARNEADKKYRDAWALRDNLKKQLDAESQQALNSMKPSAPAAAPANKAPSAPKAKSRPNLSIIQIQKNLGAKETGHWNPDTNRRFIAFMNSEPKYKEMMAGGKFNGTLQEAVQLTGQLQTVKQMDSEDIIEHGPPKLPHAENTVKQEDDKEVPPRRGPFGGPGVG